MRARRLHLSLLALAAAALLAGCGSSSSSTTGTKASTSSSPATGTAPTTSSGPATGATATTGAAPAPSSPELKKAAAECHRLLQADKSLPASAKAKLEDACNKVGEGKTTAVKQAAREVCEEFVAKSGLPESSPARKQALAACKK